MNSSVTLENSEINNALKQLYNSKLKEIFAEISCEFGISIDTLYEKYLIKNLEIESINLNTSKKKKRKKNKTLEPEQLCMARKADGEQCTRRRKDCSEFCGKHSGNLKYGRIDDDTKHPAESFIQCTPITLDNVDYLIDSNKVVYSYNIENPEIIGGLNKEGKLVKLSENMVNTDSYANI